MNFVDTHAHLNFIEFKPDYKEVINRAQDFGVKKIIIPGTDVENTQRAVDIATEFEGVYAALGAHPTHLKGGFSLEVDNGLPPSLLLESYDGSYSQQLFLKDFRAIAQTNNIIAIGEIGLDYKQDKRRTIASREIQICSLKAIIESTIDLSKPYIFHVRPSQDSDDALKDLYSILINYFTKNKEELKGVIHCYVGNYRWSKLFNELGFLVSYTGLITLSDNFNQTIYEIPLNKMLLETDCPYLSPNDSDRERSEPIDIVSVAKKIAQIKKVKIEAVAETTTSRAEELFGI